MRVQRVIMPDIETESWTLLGDDLLPVESAEDYLGYLCAIERSPTTVRAYAHSLKLWFEFLVVRGLSWDRAEVDDVARFVAWLRAPAANVVVLDAGAARRAPATVNRHLAGVFGFYDYQARSGAELADRLVAWRRVGRGSYKPFLHHVTKGRPIPTRPVRLAVDKAIPRTLTEQEIAAILQACTRLRDRFLFALLAETGMRVGQALGLRHADVVSRERQVRIVPRPDNVNRARAKVRGTHVIPVSAALVRLYSDYMHVEYGELGSDYVFVNLWGGPHGHPLGYPAVDGIVGRLRARTGIYFTPHMLRHSHATDLVRKGVPIEVVSKRLTHASVTTTSETYVHLRAEDVRAELIRTGVWTQDTSQ
jgi:integrase/recombinase XerD